MIERFLVEAAKKGIEEAVLTGRPFASVAVFAPGNRVFPLLFNDHDGKVHYFVKVGALGKANKQDSVVIVMDTYQRIATEEEKLNFLLTGKMERIGGPQSLAYDDRSFHALNFLELKLNPIPIMVNASMLVYRKVAKMVQWDELNTEFKVAEDAAILEWIRYGYASVKEE
jgi:hypothetical protein